MAGKDYYATLGVSKTATEAELKSAYKKAALKHHPDRNPDNPEAASKKCVCLSPAPPASPACHTNTELTYSHDLSRFKEVSEAYEALSDKDKRAIYDQFGEEGLKNGGGGPPPGSSGFGGGFPGGAGGGFPPGATFSFG
ncbi:hypothetical protein P7C70_g5165, partial [Phenoliferia sp. Uapishka_3]